MSDLREALQFLPDEIDLFRAIRAAGRSDRVKAQAVARLLAPFAALASTKNTDTEGEEG